MKKLNISKSKVLLFFISLAISFTMNAQIGGWKADLVSDAQSALTKMIEKTPKLQSYKDKAYGYAVFPKVTKGAVGVGGAAGQGIVYEQGVVVGSSKLKQASIGFQLGGQQYSEVIFFEDKKTFDNFINNKFKFDAQASAVAISPKFGASVDLAFKSGIAIFTQTKGGLMYEASVGGQHFKYTAK